MRQKYLTLVLLVVVATSTLGATTAAAVDAQTSKIDSSLDGEDTHGFAQVEGNATTTSTGSEASGGNNTKQVAERIDEDVAVVSYRYNATSETFYVTLENDGEDDSTVTITESISREDAGERRFGIEVVDVEVGETVEVGVSAKRVEGAAAVMILTEKAIESGSGVYLQESKKTDTRLIKGDPTGGQVRSAALFSGFGVVLLTTLGSWQYVATKNSGSQEAALEPKTTLLGNFRRRFK